MTDASAYRRTGIAVLVAILAPLACVAQSAVATVAAGIGGVRWIGGAVAQHALGGVVEGSSAEADRSAMEQPVVANLAEAVAEGRGKAQAATLRKTKTTTVARRLAS